jgi:hypothetical protein
MQSSTSSEVMGKEAELQVRLPNGGIKCTACARLCEIPEGKTVYVVLEELQITICICMLYGRVMQGTLIQ